MKTFRSYLAELVGFTWPKSMRFGGQTFKLTKEPNYELSGKYKEALYIDIDEDEKSVELNMNIGSDSLEKWISDTQKKVGEKKWPEDDDEGKGQEKYFDQPIIHKKIWKDAEKHFKKLGYKVELGD